MILEIILLFLDYTILQRINFNCKFLAGISHMYMLTCMQCPQEGIIKYNY